MGALSLGLTRTCVLLWTGVVALDEKVCVSVLILVCVGVGVSAFAGVCWRAEVCECVGE